MNEQILVKCTNKQIGKSKYLKREGADTPYRLDHKPTTTTKEHISTHNQHLLDLRDFEYKSHKNLLCTVV